MVLCFAIDCTHRTGRDKCSFFVFPKDCKKHALWTRVSRRADREPGKDSRLCSCHFVDGKKENGPSLFHYNARNRMTFKDPEVKKRKILKISDDDPITDLKTVAIHLKAENLQLQAQVEQLQNGHPKPLESTADPDWCSSDHIEQNYLDDKRKLRIRKDKSSEKCHRCLCDSYKQKQSIHKKYKRSFKKTPKDDITKANETSTSNAVVESVVEIAGETVESSSDTSDDSSSDSEDFSFVKIKSGNSTIIRYVPPGSISSEKASIGGIQTLDKFPVVVPSRDITSQKVHFMTATSESTPLGNTNYVLSTAVARSHVHFETSKMSSTSSSNTSGKNLLTAIKSERDIFNANNSESIKENDFPKNHSELMQSGFSNSVSEPKNAQANSQIISITHAEAFCASKTLLHYMISQDYVNNDDINFIVSLSQRIKERLTFKEEIVPENS